MRFIFVLVLTLSIGCSTIGDNVDRGLCLKWKTFIVEEIECAGGRGISEQICIVKPVARAHCVVWEWPEGRPENG